MGTEEARMDLSTIDYREELLVAAKAYCKRHGITLNRLGKRLMRDHRFFKNIAEGKGCTVDTFQRVMREMLNDAMVASPKN